MTGMDGSGYLACSVTIRTSPDAYFWLVASSSKGTMGVPDGGPDGSFSPGRRAMNRAYREKHRRDHKRFVKPKLRCPLFAQVEMSALWPEEATSCLAGPPARKPGGGAASRGGRASWRRGAACRARPGTPATNMMCARLPTAVPLRLTAAPCRSTASPCRSTAAPHRSTTAPHRSTAASDRSTAAFPPLHRRSPPVHHRSPPVHRRCPPVHRRCPPVHRRSPSDRSDKRRSVHSAPPSAKLTTAPPRAQRPSPGAVCLGTPIGPEASADLELAWSLLQQLLEKPRNLPPRPGTRSARSCTFPRALR